MATVRLLMIGIPEILRAVLRDKAVLAPQIEIVGEFARASLDSPEVDHARPDLILVDSSKVAEHDVVPFLENRCNLRILSLSPNGGSAVVHEMTPRRRPLGELSPQALIDIVSGAADGQPATGA